MQEKSKTKMEYQNMLFKWSIVFFIYFSCEEIGRNKNYKENLIKMQLKRFLFSLFFKSVKTTKKNPEKIHKV